MIAAIVLHGCTDAGVINTPTRDLSLETQGTEQAVAVLHCTATPATGALDCRGPGDEGATVATLMTTAPARDVVIGGQNVYVRLAGHGGSYDPATGILESGVTVQNLMWQPLGTPDGRTPTGVKVFFERLPVVSEGTGTVSVLDPDGTGDFTAKGQPYYRYDQLLRTGETSAVRTWRFAFPPTVVRFEFVVFVSAALPREAGPRRLVDESPRGAAGAPYALVAIHGTGDDDVFAVGSDPARGGAGVALHWDGARWETLPIESGGEPFTAVWADGRGSAFIAAASYVVRWSDGVATRYALPKSKHPAEIGALWGFSPTRVYALSATPDALAPGDAFAFDGKRWSTLRVVNPDRKRTVVLTDIAGSGARDAVVVGGLLARGTAEDLVVRFSGTSVDVGSAFTGQPLRAVWAASPSASFAVGPSAVVALAGGAARVIGTSGGVDVTGSSPSDVWVVSEGRVANWDGRAWVSLDLPLSGVRAAWSAGAGNVYFVGAGGLLHAVR